MKGIDGKQDPLNKQNKQSFFTSEPNKLTLIDLAWAIGRQAARCSPTLTLLYQADFNGTFIDASAGSCRAGFVDAVTQRLDGDVVLRVMPRRSLVQEDAGGQVKRAGVENFLLNHPRAAVPSFSHRCCVARPLLPHSPSGCR